MIPAAMRVAFIVVLVGAVLGITGCGSSSSSSEAPSDTSRCLDVPPSIVAAIEEGLTVTGGGSLRLAQAVRSDDFLRVYFISADIQGSGLTATDDVGTWSTNKLENHGVIFAVDEMAKEFSEWGDGGSTDAHLSMTDDGAQESVDCVRQNGH